jgi:hypothetical protein
MKNSKLKSGGSKSKSSKPSRLHQKGGSQSGYPTENPYDNNHFTPLNIILLTILGLLIMFMIYYFFIKEDEDQLQKQSSVQGSSVYLLDGRRRYYNDYYHSRPWYRKLGFGFGGGTQQTSTQTTNINYNQSLPQSNNSLPQSNNSLPESNNSLPQSNNSLPSSNSPPIMEEELQPPMEEPEMPPVVESMRGYGYPSYRGYLVNKERERLINPLLPPERSYVLSRGGMPSYVSMPTRGYSGGFQQLGLLYKTNQEGNDNNILPLFGRPTHTNSNKWYYYTASDKFHSLKIPIKFKGKECNDQHGCNELYDDDVVSVEPYNGEFKVKIYGYDSPKFIM